MLDDPDVLAVLEEEGEEEASTDAEEGAFKADISRLRDTIRAKGFRSLGEYLASLDRHDCKRNRDGQHLRTDRQMYREELALIFSQQAQYHGVLSDQTQAHIEDIIFHQRPLKLKKDRVGKCSLESGSKRCAVARLEYQRFRYLQDINNLQYLSPYTDRWESLSTEDRGKLATLFDKKASIPFAGIRKALGLDKKMEFNLETGVKKLRGNTTACAIRQVYPAWDTLDASQQQEMVEDLLSIRKKSALKTRLINHWGLSGEDAVHLCMVELEPEYGNVSLKAIRKLLPFLEEGKIYSDARVSAGYGYEKTVDEVARKLGRPPELPNPIVNKALHELKRVVNALIAEYGKPDVIRIEMARDLEMNTKRYKTFVSQQKKNTKANDKAVEVFQDEAKKHPSLGLSKYPSRDQKLRYRLWEDQNHCCAYSGQMISRGALFSADVEVDHIIPYSQSLDDSYMNKVVCFARENHFKGQRTPVDAFGGSEEKWHQITRALANWGKTFPSKRKRFYTKGEELEKDFIGSQLTDTRYIAREAGNYLEKLGCDITFTRGVMTSWLRRQWELNDLIGKTDLKERSDHRHHTIDAVVTACIDRSLYNALAKQAKSLEREHSRLSMNDLYFDPPIEAIKDQLRERLEKLIVSHVPQRKITGAYHEDTGVGYIEGVGTVYRKRLSPDFTSKNARNIIDDTVRELVLAHIQQHGGKSKTAFAEGFKLYHRDGKTPIKRVRVVQSKTTRDKLDNSKLAIKDKTGEAFKWHAYGNTHHVEILRHRNKPNKYLSCFVTTMEAARRRPAKKGEKYSLIKTDHGADWEFLMALHINDLVEVEVDGRPGVYRVQKLEMDGNRITLRTHAAATISDPEEGIRKSIGALLKTYKMRPLLVNAIGKAFRHDQADH